MKICVAQTRPAKGNIAKNIEEHIRLVALAGKYGADLVVFPELSLTGYEPTIAHQLAYSGDEPELKRLSISSEQYDMVICPGMPLRSDKGVQIGMLILEPNGMRHTYAKQHLHSDELPYFVPGGKFIILDGVALAICYEISIAEHIETAHKLGARAYVASVAKDSNAIGKSHDRLSTIAQSYSIPVLMANCTGQCDGMECGGMSAAWDNNGKMIESLDKVSSGILLLNTQTMEATSQML